MNVTNPGHQRLIAVNDIPIFLEEPFVGHPEQTAEARKYVQGGPRTAIYYVGAKMVKGSFRFPVCLSPDGGLDPAAEELLRCAEYPLRPLHIDTNYLLSKYNITVDTLDWSGDPNLGFDVYQRMAIVDCVITELKLTVPNEGPAMIDVKFLGAPSLTDAAVVADPASSALMRRAIVYADCDVHLQTPEFHWDTARSFEMTISNEVEPIIVLMNPNPPVEQWTDLPREFEVGETKISGQIIESVDRGAIADESEVLPSGGLMGQRLTFDLSGVVLMEFPLVVMHLTEQPIGRGMLERTTRFQVVFSHPRLDSVSDGHFMTFPT